MKPITFLSAVLCISVFVFNSCKEDDPSTPPEDNFELGTNHFVWEGKTFDLALHKWTSESYNASTELYKFDYVLNDINEDHELYFEDFLSSDSMYVGSYTFEESSVKHGEFDWFQLDINQTGNTADTVFRSKSALWTAGQVEISRSHGYLIIEFSMTYDDGRVLTGYYAEEE